MTQDTVWQYDCPGYVEMKLVEGQVQVICYVEEQEPPRRVTDGLLALYTFREGSGRLVRDLSGAGTPLDLTIESEAAVSWISGGGLAIHSDTMLITAGPAIRLTQAAKASNQITIEAWVKPATTLQFGPARIVTLSGDFHNRNFHIGQAEDIYDVRVRTTATTDNGRPSLDSPAASLTTNLTHVLYTRDLSGAARLYLDAAVVAEMVVSGDFSGWNASYSLAVANEVIGSRPWLGECYLVAVYNRALTSAEVSQNFQAGPLGS